MKGAAEKAEAAAGTAENAAEELKTLPEKVERAFDEAKGVVFKEAGEKFEKAKGVVVAEVRNKFKKAEQRLDWMPALFCTVIVIIGILLFLIQDRTI